ncbi:hypothetical protein ACJW31_07G014700 [Castanea mollissima]
MVTLAREQQYHKRKMKIYYFLSRIFKKIAIPHPLLNISTDVVGAVPVRIKQIMIKCKAKGGQGGCCHPWDFFLIFLLYAYIHTHTHTHTHIYIYIYIYKERERER